MEKTIKDNLTEWEKLSIVSYQVLLAEIKEAFKVQSDEVISVTEKTIKYSFGFFSFLFGASIFIHDKSPFIPIFAILIFTSLYNLYLGYKIVTTREGFEMGTIPDEVITKDFNDVSFNEDEKEKLIYLNTIHNYEIKHKATVKDNGKRGRKYKSFFLFLLINISLISGFVIITIS